MPVTGWSRDHGDLRAPHFVGLHAIQALALIALASRRVRRSAAVRSKLVIAGAASYATLFGLLLWQALRGVSFAAPDATAAASLAIWAVSTLVVAGAILLGSRRVAADALTAVAL